jgi:hypothetical protein
MINAMAKYLTIYFVFLGISAALAVFVPDIGIPLLYNTATFGAGVIYEIQGFVL